MMTNFTDNSSFHLLQNKSSNVPDEKIKVFRENDLFCDVRLVSDDGMVFPAHRVLLASHSEKLKTILTKVGSASSSSLCLYLSGVAGLQLGLILDFMYCGEVRVNQISLLKFLQVAKNLEVVGLVEEQLEEQVDEVDKESKDIKDENMKKNAPEMNLSGDIKHFRTLESNTARETIILDDDQTDMDYYEDENDFEIEEISTETPPPDSPKEFIEEMVTMTHHMQNKKNLREFALEILSKPMPRLPCPVQFMNYKQLRDWLLPELYKDIIEQGKRPVRRIRYGDLSCLPLCWPEEIFPWHLVTNIVHPQRNKPEGVSTMVEVLKVAVVNRLKAKDIDPDSYISESYSEDMDIRKKRARGIPTKVK